MSTAEIRSEIHEIIDRLDESFLKVVYSMLDAYEQEQKDSGYVLSAEDVRELNRRRSRHINGESKSFSWSEVKDDARASL